MTPKQSFNPNQPEANSKSIRINPVNFGFIWIHSDWKFELIRIGRIYFGLNLKEPLINTDGKWLRIFSE